MKDSKKIYWKGIGELKNSAEAIKNSQVEFNQPGPEEDLGHSRRDFLKMMGFGVSAVSLAACEAPIRKAIPYVNKPVDLDPSLPNYYASTYINGGDAVPVVVKTREGRPIKVDGNALSKVTQGGTNAQVEASVLSLYDNSRLRGPRGEKKGDKRDTPDWAGLDKMVTDGLNQVAAANGNIRIVSNTIVSPSLKAVLAQFKAKYPTTEHVQYDQVSVYGTRLANLDSFGSAFIPSYDFSKAKVIVSIAADFLNSWGSSIENTKQYAAGREVGAKAEMSRHYQFESVMSLTGANADYRTQIKPSEEGAVVVQLYNLLAAKAGRAGVGGGVDKPNLEKAANELWANRGKALVIAGSNDPAVQIVVNGINDILGSYGTTILPGLEVTARQGDDKAMAQFVDDLVGNKIGAVIFLNCNPVYDHPRGKEIAEALKNVSVSVSTSYKEEETGLMVKYLAPDHHYLESWNDAEIKKNHFSLGQPAITPIFKTRAAGESLMVWAGVSEPDYFEFVKNNWKSWYYKDQTVDFQTFWDKCLYDGVYELPVAETAVSFKSDVAAAASVISKNTGGEGFEVVIFENGTVGNGSQANNPLLQELPDPITKIVWDHYVTVSLKDASGISFDESKTKYATITANGNTIKVPVMVLPGQAPGTIGLPLGYGRTAAGKAADNIGQNAYPLVSWGNGTWSYSGKVDFKITDEDYQLAQTQTQNTYMGRQTVIQETTAELFNDGTYQKEKFKPEINTWKSETHKMDPEKLSIWKGHDYKNHHWGMAIDLNACTGCGACVVACNVENNVSIVGREEVINRREMHWLRIDRYFSSDSSAEDWEGVEIASANPEVVFQPMLCQHCNNAPCETVCPVAATTHSSEGLNQMAYNRCIGTRYCANNCPYKVRRFNWFKYHDNSQFEVSNAHMNSDLGKMVLNPDVTVRSRGVMEKCTFCVQRIQAGKLNAKKERRPVKDGEVVTACAAACTTGAIVFGDFNNPESKVAKLLQIRPLYADRPMINDKEADNPRAYTVLEEINTRPNIFYLAKVRNKDSAKA